MIAQRTKPLGYFESKQKESNLNEQEMDEPLLTPSSLSKASSVTSKDIWIRVKGDSEKGIQEQRFHVADIDILKNKSEFFKSRCSTRWSDSGGDVTQTQCGQTSDPEITLEGPEAEYIGYVLEYIQDPVYEFPKDVEQDCLDALQYFGVAERGRTCAKHGTSIKNLLTLTKLAPSNKDSDERKSFLVTSLPEPMPRDQGHNNRWRYRISFGTYTLGLLVQAPSGRWLVKHRPIFRLGDFILFDWAYLLCQSQRKNPEFSMHGEFLYFYSLYIPIYFSTGSTGGISHFVDVECAQEVEHWDDLKIQVMGEVSSEAPSCPMIYRDLEGGWAHFCVEKDLPGQLHLRVRSTAGTKDSLSAFHVDDSGEFVPIPIVSVHVYSDYWNKDNHELDYYPPGSFRPQHCPLSGIKRVYVPKSKPFAPLVSLCQSLGYPRDVPGDYSADGDPSGVDVRNKPDAPNPQRFSKPQGPRGARGYAGCMGPGSASFMAGPLGNVGGLPGIVGCRGRRRNLPESVLSLCQPSQCIVYSNNGIPSVDSFLDGEPSDQPLDKSATIGSLEEDLCWTERLPGPSGDVEKEKLFSVDHVREAAKHYNAIPAELRAGLSKVQETALGESVLVDHLQETVIYHVTFPKNTVHDMDRLHVVVVKNVQPFAIL